LLEKIVEHFLINNSGLSGVGGMIYYHMVGVRSVGSEFLSLIFLDVLFVFVSSKLNLDFLQLYHILHTTPYTKKAHIHLVFKKI
jgi:hypothetical protein